MKVLCYYEWKAWYKLLSSSGLKKNICTFISSTRHPFEEHKILGNKYCVAKYSEKVLNKWKFIFRKNNWERKINCHVLQIAKVHISYAIWFMISEKKCYEVAASSRCSGRATHVYTKILSEKQGIQKHVLEFPILSALNYYLHMYLWF